MGFFRRKSTVRIPKARRMTEREAVEKQESEGRQIYDRAFDDYLAGRITKAQFNARVRRSTRISRGY